MTQSLDTPDELRRWMRSLALEGSSQQLTLSNEHLQAELAYQNGLLYHVTMMTANGPLEGDTAVVHLLHVGEQYPVTGLLETVPMRTTVNVRSEQQELLEAPAGARYLTTPLTTGERLERLKVIMARKGKAATAGAPADDHVAATFTRPHPTGSTAPVALQTREAVSVTALADPITTPVTTPTPALRPNAKPLQADDEFWTPALLDDIPTHATAPAPATPNHLDRTVTLGRVAPAVSGPTPAMIPDDAPELHPADSLQIPAAVWTETQRVMTGTIGPAAMMLMSKAAREIGVVRNEPITLHDARRLHTTLINHVPEAKRDVTARTLQTLINTLRQGA